MRAGDARLTPEIALTFDDGPHPEHTPRVLDRLAERGIAATFFVVGRPARSHSAIVRRIAAEGHELGNHTYTHLLPGRVSTRALIGEVRSTRKLLEDLTGRSCNLFRPPRGELTAGKLLGLWRAGQTVVLWNVDPRDSSPLAMENIVGWCRRYRPRGGDIILMHDDGPQAVDAVPELAKLATTGEARFVLVSECIQRSHGRNDLDVFDAIG